MSVASLRAARAAYLASPTEELERRLPTQRLCSILLAGATNVDDIKFLRIEMVDAEFRTSMHMASRRRLDHHDAMRPRFFRDDMRPLKKDQRLVILAWALRRCAILMRPIDSLEQEAQAVETFLAMSGL